MKIIRGSMIRFSFFIFLISRTASVSGQNLISNPGFENYDSLPCDFILYSSQFALYMHNWFLPTNGTSDIISPLIPSTCNYGNPASNGSCGSQYPRTGNVMAGLVAQSFSSYEEYLEIEIDTPLVIGKSYYLEYYTLSGVCSDFVSNDIGAAFSTTLVSDTTINGNLELMPVVVDTTLNDDTTTWKKISTCFVADSAYRYLIIGNFRTVCEASANGAGVWPMSYSFIDDVLLQQDSLCSSKELSCDPVLSVTSSMTDDNKFFIQKQDDVLLLHSDVEGLLQIFSITGEIKFSSMIKEPVYAIDISQLSSGLYILSFINSSIKKSHKGKFIINHY